MDQQTPQPEYKPNIYPIIYWALVYGIIAATALFAVHLLAGIIALVWFPVFLAGVIWGGYRKYQQDKAAWAQTNGTSTSSASGAPNTPMQEFKNAARDIAKAGQEMITRQAIEDIAVEQAVQEEILTQENAEQENAEQSVPETSPEEIITQAPETVSEEKPVPPQSPLQPLV
ncbi:MAG: hypothetical protein AAB649_05370 [Patescibacteria group bacterium]